MSEYQYASPDATQNIHFLPDILHLLPSAPARILEVGCGNGHLAARLSTLGYDVIALDTSQSGVQIARAAHPDINFHVASAYDDMRQSAGHCDVVLSVEVIEHLTSPRRFLENAFAVLKPGGCLVLTTPYHGYLKNLAISLLNRWDRHFGVDWEGGHIKFFSPKTLAPMALNAGFKNPRFRFVGRVPWLWKSMIMIAQKC
jgi:2-polyprenyl-6-hydroxyphenyl methylase/3-demethylubiquinone-9 3-methyltransferase